MIWEETQKENNMIAATEYYYDANGNQIGKLFSDLSDQTGAAASISLENQLGTINCEYYQYDGFNRSTAYHTPTTTADYTYNTQGLESAKQSKDHHTDKVWTGPLTIIKIMPLTTGSTMIGFEQE